MLHTMLHATTVLCLWTMNSTRCTGTVSTTGTAVIMHLRGFSICKSLAYELIYYVKKRTCTGTYWLTVKSSLYYLEPQFGWQPTTFHRPQIYLLSYFIDFRQLRFGLQMKVNAGGCTHRDKLDVVSKYKILPSLHINSCMHMRACISRGLSGTPAHVDIYRGGRD